VIDIFSKIIITEYRGDVYHVKDNGAIFREKRLNKNKRPLDEKWTFGKLSKQKGYLYIASESVHRIVATAFHGKQPSDKHIVDHIDTNKLNNRPENLRWVTRIENLLLNPITLSRIIYKYGSIDNFLSDPKTPLDGKLDQNFDWMRTVTKEESDNTRKNLLNWAKQGKVTKNGALGEWVYSKIYTKREEEIQQSDYTASLTKFAIQKKWKTPTEFPNCPSPLLDNAIIKYHESLEKGVIFSRNTFGESTVEDRVILSKTNELLVISKSDSIKPYALAKIYIDNNHIVHESIRTFFKEIGAQKAFTIAQGLEWHGEDSIDDYS